MNAWAITFEHDDLYECFTDSAENSWAEWLEGRLQSKEYFEAKGYRCVEVKVTEKPAQPESAEPVAWLHHCSDNEDKEFRCVDFDSHHALSVHRGDIPLYAKPTTTTDNGMVRVPVEPNEAMQEAARNVSAGYPYKPVSDGQRLGYLQVGLIWKAMLEAAKEKK